MFEEERLRLDAVVPVARTPKEYLIAAYTAKTGQKPPDGMKLAEIGSIAAGKDLSTWRALNWATKQMNR